MTDHHYHTVVVTGYAVSFEELFVRSLQQLYRFGQEADLDYALGSAIAIPQFDAVIHRPYFSFLSVEPIPKGLVFDTVGRYVLPRFHTDLLVDLGGYCKTSGSRDFVSKGGALEFLLNDHSPHIYQSKDI